MSNLSAFKCISYRKEHLIRNQSLHSKMTPILLWTIIGSLLLNTFAEAQELKQGCPPEDDIEPCICAEEFGNRLTLSCEYLNDNDLSQLLTAIALSQEYKIHTFELKESDIQDLPSSLLANTHFDTVLINGLRAVNFDPFALVQGLEDTLAGMQIENIVAMNWKFSSLKRFKHFHMFSYNGGMMPPPFPDDVFDLFPETMKVIQIRNGGLRRIAEPGLSRFPDLTYLGIEHNPLFELKRDLLPRPAKLTNLELTGNQLSSLPDDFFEDMPALEDVLLGFNQFETVKEETFDPVWSQLYTLHLGYNPMRCDCDVSWIVTKQDAPENLITPYCQSPANFKGKLLGSLSLNELCPKS